MPDQLWNWMGDLHRLLPSYWVGVIVTIASVICGGLIGIEREKAQKPAGMRTMILICLGAAIFTQASILISNGPLVDRSRIAAQIVTGIGFLGAGAIIRERGLLIGLTTAAAIWATAAVGIVLGSGYVAAALFFTLLIVATLAGVRATDRWILGPCRYRTIRLEYDPADGRARYLIQGILDDHQHLGETRFEVRPDGTCTAQISYCHSHRDHRVFLSVLMALPHIRRVQDEVS